MAKNDMHLIIFKILKFLYGCNKAGKIPTFTDILKAIELSTIPESYFRQIIEELIKCGYIDGIHIIATKDGGYIDVSENARVTIEGVEYLNDNSLMHKAADVAGKAFEVLIDALASAAMPL